MQEDTHVFQGMKLNTHPIKLDSNFLWEAHNIRLTNREDNTLFSITNEKGTKDTGLSFNGIYLGHCVLGKYLVVFTAEREGNSYIYRVEKNDDNFTKVILFKGKDLLDPDYPIEAIGNVETEYVLKVYWVDGKHLPRVINIIDTDLSDNITLFDFIQTLQLKETVEVELIYGSGNFSPGTILYAFSYYNKNMLESNIFYTTPLHYIAYSDRGGKEDEHIEISFSIKISNPDNFDYLRVYSIHRTTLDALPTVKVVEDIFLTLENEVVLIDSGNKGYTIDPLLLLYTGGKSIIAKTIHSKNNHLFLGNIKYDNNYNDIKNIITSTDTQLIDYTIKDSFSLLGNLYYKYYNLLTNKNSARFKTNETYRCGIQFLYKNGVWSDPIHLKDTVISNSYPSISNSVVNFNTKAFVLNPEIAKQLLSIGIINARTCIVFPSIFDRDIVCQGILCPTLGVAKYRNKRLLYSQSSWFFRPTLVREDPLEYNEETTLRGSNIQYLHNKPLYSGPFLGAEILNMKYNKDIKDIFDISEEDYYDYSNYYFIDENVITLHSPEIEFETSLLYQNLIDTKIKIIGQCPILAIIGDCSITTQTPAFNKSARGEEVFSQGYPIENNGKYNNGGLVAGLFYHDDIIYKYTDTNDKTKYGGIDPTFHLVYPWHRSGSLNNDEVRGEGQGSRSGVLGTKVISNLKYFNTMIPIKELVYSTTDPQVFNSNEISIKVLSPKFLNKSITYLGNVDLLATTDGTEYNLYKGVKYNIPNEITDSYDGYSAIKTSKEPVRIKYKSSPHIVLSLKNDLDSNIVLLPSHKLGSDVNDCIQESSKIPIWDKYFEGKKVILDSEGKEVSMLGHVEVINTMSLQNQNINYDWENTSGSEYFEMYTVPGAEEDEVVIALRAISLDGGFYLILKNIKENDIIVLEYGHNHIIKGGTLFPFTSESDYKEHSHLDNYLLYNGEKINYLIVGIANSNVTCLNGVCTSYKIKKTSVTENVSTNTYNYRDLFINKSNSPYILLAELYRNIPLDTKFGGSGELALLSNLWLPASNPINITDATKPIEIPYEYGDTWYQRYDCLKTYPYTKEDENLIVEIGSFVCETRINLDGRSDRNRGLLSNINVSPQNFNIINKVYTLKDNFYNYKILPKQFYNTNYWPQQIIWSKQKSLGEDIDTWPNITLSNVLDLDGSKGEIVDIKSFNELLVAFQEQAVSKINFNSRVLIPTSDGVPIEITNSYKVDGYDTYSNIIGCQDKNSIINTEDGIYFIDNNSNSLYKFNGQLTNISDTLGMKSWFKDNKFNYKWKPIPGALNKNNGIRSFYDYENGDIYFTPGWDNIDKKYTTRDALCYSNKLLAFSSLMSYGGTLAMFNYCGDFYSLRYNPNESEEKIKLYLNNAGDYNDFYGETKGWDFSFISNDGSAVTKVFDTLELRTDVYNSSKELLNSCPMNFIKVDNEYLNTEEVTLDRKNMRKKFRIWRSLIPRNKGTRERIRNPWTKITLGWNPLLKQESENSNNSAIVHDVTVRYTV